MQQLPPDRAQLPHHQYRVDRERLPETMLAVFQCRVCQAGRAEEFEHLNFEPVQIVDCEGQAHGFHFAPICSYRVGRCMLSNFAMVKPAGYRFQIIGDAEEDLLALFGQLVEKLRRALSIKHLKQGSLGVQIADQVVRGRISWDEAENGRAPLLVIDGREITGAQFGHMLMTFEGWQFKLEILDKSEEL